MLCALAFFGAFSALNCLICVDQINRVAWEGVQWHSGPLRPVKFSLYPATRWACPLPSSCSTLESTTVGICQHTGIQFRPAAVGTLGEEAGGIKEAGLSRAESTSQELGSVIANCFIVVVIFVPLPCRDCERIHPAVPEELILCPVLAPRGDT